MKANKLYKYLDVDGGLAMLSNSNLQFTNATRLNDPFDCHPSLIDFSNVPEKRMRVWGKDFVMSMESNRYEHYRDGAWVCSLSKVNNSLLMWSYYSNHRGVCIGLDMEKTRKCLSNILCSNFIGAFEFDVQYKEIIEKPDYFKHKNDFDLLRYQLSAKAKEWEHEREVRLVLINPTPAVNMNHPCMVTMALPYEPKDKTKAVDWREVRAYHKISGECFESVYLGVNVDEDKRNQIIEVAKKLNPDIKIYQMRVDVDAFRLQPEQIY
ncbi:MAG: DUF2971 domain-containing protein [Prevotella sp.]|nr:DUF2971 domain-containing protein [Prevotella sp.]